MEKDNDMRVKRMIIGRNGKLMFESGTRKNL